MMRHRIALFLLVCPFTIVLATSSIAQSIQVPAGFVIEPIANIPNVAAIEVAPSGSFYGDFLYVATRGVEDDPNDPDHIRRVNLLTREVEIYYILQPESDPIDMEFGHEAELFPDKLFITLGNRDGNRPGDNGGSIIFLDPNPDPDDSNHPLDPNDPTEEHFLHPASGDPTENMLSEPGVLSFDHGGFFMGDLLVSNTTDIPFYDIARITPSGDRSPFISFPPADPNNPEFRRATSMDFPPSGSAFDYRLYFADNGGIRRVTSVGMLEGVPFAVLPKEARRPIMAFSSGPYFGDYLYAFGQDEIIYRIDSTGSCEVFATGFTGLTANDPTFDDNGKHLYVWNAGTIYRISAAASGSVNLGFGSITNVLFINNGVGEINVNTGAPIELKLNPAPLGPATTGIYAIYFWPGRPSNETDFFIMGESAGCFVNLTPFQQPEMSDRPTHCLTHTSLPGTVCASVRNRLNGGSVPLTRSFSTGAEITVTIQAFLRDNGSVNSIGPPSAEGISVSNAIILNTIDP